MSLTSLMDVSSPASAIFWSVVLLRFLVPLLIPLFPLPAILACLFLDSVDQSLFQNYASFHLPGYQAYDKALDIFYLAIAMFATLRNWTNYTAVQLARLLFYWRLVGVTVFEMTGWRVLLLVFPNTFESFFIFYEIVRSRWAARRLGRRELIVAAVLMTVLLKLPQEYWIHVARRDFTDSFEGAALDAGNHARWSYGVAQGPVAWVLIIALMVGLCWLVGRVVRRLMGPPTHALTLKAAKLPTRIDEAHERDRNIARRWRLFDLHLLEKTVLVAFVTMIFAQIVPGVRASAVQLATSVTVIVTINAFLRIRVARAGESIESAALSFLALAVTNGAIVAVARRLLPQDGGGFTVITTAFFLLLLTLIVTLYDRWHPVFDVRFSGRAPL